MRVCPLVSASDTAAPAAWEIRILTYRARPVGARDLKRQLQLVARDSNIRFPVAEIVIGGQ